MWCGKVALAAVTVLAITGCARQNFVAAPPAPLSLETAALRIPEPSRPTGTPAANQVTAPLPRPGPDSSTLGTYYQLIENRLQSQGLLRTDGGGADTPWDTERLARTFFDLAFYKEYAPNEGVFQAQLTSTDLGRFEQPVRIELRFGASVPPQMRYDDTRTVKRYAKRLAAATNHPIRTVDKDGNFIVFVVNEEERRSLGPTLRELAPGFTQRALNSIIELPESNHCVVFTVDALDDDRYSRAISIIRAEHPDLLRQSCYHEEIAQGLGLSNDSPRARPSIFNDNDEFALLTRMDEQLMRILYDPRLRPGMSLEEARPIVSTIAEEIVGPAE